VTKLMPRLSCVGTWLLSVVYAHSRARHIRALLPWGLSRQNSLSEKSLRSMWREGYINGLAGVVSHHNRLAPVVPLHFLMAGFNTVGQPERPVRWLRAWVPGGRPAAE
jgi:hypothetical protein